MQVKKYGKPCTNCLRFYTCLFSSISINDKLTILFSSFYYPYLPYLLPISIDSTHLDLHTSKWLIFKYKEGMLDFPGLISTYFQSFLFHKDLLAQQPFMSSSTGPLTSNPHTYAQVIPLPGKLPHSHTALSFCPRNYFKAQMECYSCKLIHNSPVKN